MLLVPTSFDQHETFLLFRRKSVVTFFSRLTFLYCKRKRVQVKTDFQVPLSAIVNAVRFCPASGSCLFNPRVISELNILDALFADLTRDEAVDLLKKCLEEVSSFTRTLRSATSHCSCPFSLPRFLAA